MTNPELFLAVSLLTFLITRTLIWLIPAKTITGYLRHKTLLYVHHIYIGVVLLALVLPLIIAFGASTPLVILSAIGVALCLDELSAWLLYSHYPARKEFLVTLALFFVFALYLYLL